MWLIDEWAERHIITAQQNGELNELPGMGQPLQLDDDRGVPAELRAAYRLLKNAGCLPPELENRKEALQLSDLLANISQQHPDYPEIERRLRVLELRLIQAGMSTDFLHGEYSTRLNQRFSQPDED
ncbi:DUF1992 domain-containing protein [Affinibrenneria salicis]|uniref:DUF1992 domain-containing protein n=1 Tax=Affinibrenneria salicis TaxID=2590031 RepID=A0A5J5FQM6_9GAMM|nr:DUF1992 domain-containing protein [Affinibrenneria salicis]KAA8994863.1 DUF1992 domain-containing protein [Affinibrenneria salicis]